MEGGRDKSRLCTRLIDGVKKSCHGKLLKLRDVKVLRKNTEKWRYFMNSENGAVNV